MKMSIYGRFVIEEKVFVRTVRHGHDVDILEFRTGLAPITMGKDVMSTDFAARFNLPPWWNRPVKKRVESRHTKSASRRFDMFQES